MATTETCPGILVSPRKADAGETLMRKHCECCRGGVMAISREHSDLLRDFNGVLSEVSRYQQPDDPCPAAEAEHVAWVCRTIAAAIHRERDAARAEIAALRERLAFYFAGSHD